MALRIREEAEIHGVQLFESPTLARAVYFTTELEESIPEDLYYAVAQVIAYVYNLNAPNPEGRLERPVPSIPKSMHFNSNGKRESGG